MKPTPKRSKNFFPSLAITIVLWVGILLVILLVSPETFTAHLLFFLLLFSATFFTVALFTNRIIGVLVAIIITLVLIARLSGFRF